MLPQERYKRLKEYLSVENSVLLNVIDKYQELDQIAYDLGVLEESKTFTETISWWPMISILGTFSAGKSTFINEYIGQPIQQSGNQAIDDKFTVICYGNSKEVVTLPGLALDADPRFPFYNISEEVNKVDPGEGSRVNSYLQLKTLHSSRVKGKILIDSPGFDADSQRDAILKITNHIVEISDLVLIFFDARHPEPGAMRDTLEHLVGNTISHRDSTKVLYILNQIDTTAKQDNLEDVIGSWQRALSQEGLVSGNFYGIYSEASAEHIEDEALYQRLKSKRDSDFAKIIDRMDKVGIERAYRIVKSLDDFAKVIKEEQLPLLKEALEKWRGRLVLSDSISLLLLGGLLGFAHVEWNIFQNPLYGAGATLGALALWLGVHIKVSGMLSRSLAKRYEKQDAQLGRAIEKNTTFMRSLFGLGSKWYSKAILRIDTLIGESKLTIQALNDQYVSPSGNQEEKSESHSA
jgi:hypothetical protein